MPLDFSKRLPIAVLSLSVFSGPALAAPAAQPWPMGMLQSFGPQADELSQLLWGLLWLSIAVVVITTGLTLIGTFRHPRPAPGEFPPVQRAAGGISWIYVGVGISILALIGYFIWTVVTMAAIDSPSSEPRLTIEVTGHQWWWEVTYIGQDKTDTFETANEIHMPVGQPVNFRFKSADVIHTFWVPALGGKTDLIPGRTNTGWLQAEKAGTYLGQCDEYCGLQHAHMGLRVIAESPAEFQRWWANQQSPAEDVQDEEAAAGRQEVVVRCGSCHTIRGTNAGGEMGPDLTHLMTRQTLAAGMLENNIANLSGWIANPQNIKPGTKMPNIEMSGPELDDVRAYLLTLD